MHFEADGARAHAYFTRLGDRIEDAWRGQMYAEKAFPGIARRLVSEDLPHRSVSPSDIIRWALTARTLGPQPNAEIPFGEPPITLYASRRFYIEALFWFDGTTSIHQHGFSGAFCVLAGSSVHSTYQFREMARTSSRLLVGDLRHQHSEILGQGDMHEIAAGPGFIHGLFHLDRPSVSIVVRTPTDAEQNLQYNYLPPYVAYNPFDRLLWNRRAVDYVEAALAMHDESAPDLAVAALRNADDLGAFNLMRALFARQAAADSRAEVLATNGGAKPDTEAAGDALVSRTFHAAAEELDRKLGSLAQPVLQSLEATQRTGEIVATRKRATGKDHRFFLALLMNVPKRGPLLELVAKNRPGEDPVELVCRWLRELSSGDDALLHHALEEDVVVLVDAFLRTGSVDQCVAALSRKHRRELLATEVEAIVEAIASLHEVPVLGSLLTTEDAPALETFLHRA